MPDHKPPRLAVTLPEAAEMLGMSLRSLRRLVDNGTIVARYPNAFLRSLPTEPPREQPYHPDSFATFFGR